jgi:hypothetical protein
LLRLTERKNGTNKTKIALDRITYIRQKRITAQGGRRQKVLIFNYPSKKALAANIGKPLDFTETSFFGPEFKPDGVLTGSNRPSITGIKGREFFANVTMVNGLIAGVK